MALLTSYGEANRVIESALSVTYEYTKIYGKWTYMTSISTSTTYDEVYQYTRRARKSYRYVGMTLAAARECRDAMMAKYIRGKFASKWNESGNNAGTFTYTDGGVVLMADVSLQHDDGDAYSVHVDVNETDVKNAVSCVNAGSHLFNAERSDRSYDGEVETLDSQTEMPVIVDEEEEE